jgi:hypothetical protein
MRSGLRYAANFSVLIVADYKQKQTHIKKRIGLKFLLRTIRIMDNCGTALLLLVPFFRSVG